MSDIFNTHVAAEHRPNLYTHTPTVKKVFFVSTPATEGFAADAKLRYDMQHSGAVRCLKQGNGLHKGCIGIKFCFDFSHNG